MTRCPQPGCGASLPCPFHRAATAATAQHAENARRGRAAKRRGAAVEEVARYRLMALGVLQVQRIETGWRVLRRGAKIVGATPIRNVAGDFRGILPGGRSVLCESKYRPGRLCFSDLEAHQVAALTEHADAGGLSLLAWSWGYGDAVMRWPVPGFAPRTSIVPAAAERLMFVLSTTTPKH